VPHKPVTRGMRQLGFLRERLLAWILAGMVCLSFPIQSATKTDTTRDFTFFLFSDIHLGAENLKAKQPFTKADTLTRVKSNVEAMRGLVGQPYPAKPPLAGLDLGPIVSPRALIILGDVTDGHKEPAEQQDQRSTFDGLFPVSDVHYICLNLCPADTTDAQTPFKYGKPGPGSWNDPQGALSFLKGYLARHVGASRDPIVLMQHYGFDGFSLNDWNWWTPKQRRALYELLKDYNVAAFFHGHNHHAEHYRGPDPS